MPFDPEIQRRVDDYARGDLAGDLDYHIAFFSFIDEPELRRRVGEEYFTARYIYKLLEGIRSEDAWAKRAQVQLQVQQYASIYEACLHYFLFERCADRQEVQDLLHLETLKPWSVSTELLERLNRADTPDGRRLVAAIESTIKLEKTKVRFDAKAQVAERLGIIDQELCNDLIDFYTARNMIHIHAELKRGASWEWEIEFAKQAYWRLAKFKSQVETWLEANPQARL